MWVLEVGDFEPAASIGTLSFILITNPSLPIKSVADLVKTARERPGQLNCASSGSNSSNHLACEMLKVMGHVDFVHVPFKGNAETINALLGGHIHAVADSTGWAPLRSIPCSV